MSGVQREETAASGGWWKKTTGPEFFYAFTTPAGIYNLRCWVGDVPTNTRTVTVSSQVERAGTAQTERAVVGGHPEADSGRAR